MTTLSNIIIYPVKALEGISVDEAMITVNGALEHDREFALMDSAGKFINGKKYPKVHLLRALYELNEMFIELSIKDSTEQFIFNLISQADEIGKWFSDFFETHVTFCRNQLSGFPDDTKAYGPTVVSLGSITEVASWFNLDSEEVIKRFRPNLLVDSPSPFWEDQLFGKEGEKKLFSIGETKFEGTNPCNRCVVPTRNPDDSVPHPDFQKIFIENREKTLPEWAEKSRFNHYYKFCVNTETPLTEAGKKITTGDEVKILN